jgi:aromatic-L-amino-acid/L-tryptophan decarboxylase
MTKKKSPAIKNQFDEETFDLEPAEIRRLGYHFADVITEYYASMRTSPIIPTKTLKQLKQIFDEPLPQQGMNPEALLLECQKKIVAHAVRFGHPQFLGWVLSPGTIMGAYADGLASTLNQNVSLSGAGMATAVELTVLDWIKKILGYDPKAAGILVSGGTSANLHALAVARNTQCGNNIRQQGLKNNDHLIIYASSEAHVCIDKAVDLLGIGIDNIRRIKVDAHFHMDLQDLTKNIQQDLNQGYHPFCVVATAGTVNTGAVDPLNSMADICKKYKLWLHVDAAYGGFIALSSQLKPLLNGIHRADSIAVDPHKWLFIPYEAGCVLVRDPHHMKKTFSYSTDYLKLDNTKSFSDGDVDFADYGIQLSRCFRALKIWMSLKQYGTQRYGRMIDQNMNLARFWRTLISKSTDFKLMAPSDLSVVCFRYEPQKISEKNKEEYLDMLNQHILKELRKERSMLISSTVLHKKLVLRACIVNYRTTKQDVTDIMNTIQILGKKSETHLRSKKK